MSQLRRLEDRLPELNLQVVVVTFEDDYFARAYVEETRMAWPMLVDEKRRLYRAYGMERGQWRQLLGLDTVRTYLSLLFRGRKLKKSHGDVRQLGGDVLVDPEGMVRYHHVQKSPADRPSVQSLLSYIQGN